MNKEYKGLLCIDFDLTIAMTSYPTIHGRIKGSKKYINKLHKDSWYIVINTCRCDDNTECLPATMAENWLLEQNIHFDQFNQHHPYLIEFYGNDSRKLAADFYIDDKNIFGLKSWKKIYKYLSKLKDFKSCLHYTKEVIEE